MSQAWSVPAILVRAATGRLCRTEAYVRDRDRSFRTVLPQVRGGGVFAAAHAHQAERPADEALQRVENRNAVVTAWARAAQERARIAEARHAEDGSAQVQATILAAFPEAADRVAA
ncbi:hypothetical protein SAMN05216360_1327 [Methylobacterium phyllostachyos]|uniref:Uncharacterized protein n=1 Tax=Methylobacterium phyllostachyos TaxID=582672 RepID=A0A1H0L749_9HYPH|nr:hypothetical protein [Methylobacterium phyllostachyos]SDO64079.1 hypothetical protein SAMN05216360_1327 [Methylobacterium phyllostachyos]